MQYTEREMPQKYSIEIVPSHKTIYVKKNEILSEALQHAGIPIRSDCNALGLCGKCLVKIHDGPLPPLAEDEGTFLSENRLDKFYRLACFYRVQDDLKIEIPDESLYQELNILQTGINRNVVLDPAVKKFSLQLQKATLANPRSFLDRLKTTLKKSDLDVPLDTLKSLPKTFEDRITAVIHSDTNIISFEGDNSSNLCYGFAIDLGTTTLVLELIDLNSGHTIDMLASTNSQTQFGADIVSRIGYSTSDITHREKLKDAVLQDLSTMVNEILSRQNIPYDSVYEIVVSGNTAMNHILLGLPLKSLSQAPFNPLFTSLPPLSANGCGFKIHSGGKLYIVPNIGSFVGGDISSGLIATDLLNKKGHFLFIDLGTNGEIVLKTDTGSLATSTAAGPAFEGMNISCGMMALPGAIHSVGSRTPLQVETIGDQPALGICGTGLIDTVAVALDLGWISSKGKILDGTGQIFLTPSISLSQKDIRELQLAVAAVRSGIRLVLEKKGLSLESLDGIFIAGAFGNYLSITNSIKIGLLPPLPKEKIHFVGNSSLAGAKALLISSPLRREAGALAENMEFFSLATHDRFQEYFVDALDFPVQT